MISVVIPTRNAEQTLVPVLAALVPASAEGLLREVILADAGSTDGTATIADAAGCNLRVDGGELGDRLSAAVRGTRGDWLLFLEPVSVLEEGWTREAAKFMETTARAGQTDRQAAVFRFAIDGYGSGARAKEFAAAARRMLTRRPRAEQGLLIARSFYEALGGHAAGEGAHGQLLSRVGRRAVTLRSRAIVTGARAG